MTKLVIAIVNWNTKDLTRDCLKSLKADIEGINNEIWVVDNASIDGSVEMIGSEFPGIKIIQNSENTGFARANNQILRIAKGEYYLLLNTDTIIPKDSIKNLIRFMDNNPRCMSAAPRLTYADGTPQPPLKALPSAWGEFRNCLAYHFFPFGKYFGAMLSDKIQKPDSDKPIKKEILSAACLLIRKEVIEKIGILGEEYFLFSEENDYFTRMRLAGFESYYLPFIDVIHLIGKSRNKRGNVDTEINFLKSRMLYYNKFYPNKIFFLKIIYGFFFCWSYIMAGLSKLIKGKKESDYQRLYIELLRFIKSYKTK